MNTKSPNSGTHLIVPKFFSKIKNRIKDIILANFHDFLKIGGWGNMGDGLRVF